MPTFTCDSGRSAFERWARKKSSSDAVEGGAGLRHELGVGHVGERGDRLDAHRPHRVPQELDADPHPLRRRERLDGRGGPESHEGVGVGGGLLERRERVGPKIAAAEGRPLSPRTMPGALGSRTRAARARPRRPAGSVRPASRATARSAASSCCPSGYQRPHRLRGPPGRAVAMAVVAGVRGVLPAERHREIRAGRAERVVVPGVHHHVGLGAHVAGDARGALCRPPVEVVLPRGEALRLVARRAHVVAARPCTFWSMGVVAVRAGDPVRVHPALEERAPVVDLVPHLPVRVVEPLLEERRAVRVGEQLSRPVLLGQQAPPRVAAGAGSRPRRVARGLRRAARCPRSMSIFQLAAPPLGRSGRRGPAPLAAAAPRARPAPPTPRGASPGRGRPRRTRRSRRRSSRSGPRPGGSPCAGWSSGTPRTGCSSSATSFVQWRTSRWSTCSPG